MNNTKKFLISIVGFGLIIRLIFVLYGAPIYFDREDFRVNGDTFAWTQMFENWYHTGVYTLNAEYVDGPFARTPGYSFFIGPLWLLCNQNWDAAFWLVVIIQIILDVIAVYLFYRIALLLFKSSFAALAAAFLYASYPFIIIWNPVAYSESVSIFLVVLSVFFTCRNRSHYDLFFSGMAIGLAVLFRPQILLFLGILGIYIFFTHFPKWRKMVITACFFGLGVLITYGLWPIRNLLVYQRFVLTMEVGSFTCYTEDVTSFREYTYAVKSEWEPQFTSILTNSEVRFPDIAYDNMEDSAILAHTINLCKTCGSGFSNWPLYWKEPIDSGDCNEEIVQAFTGLRQRFVARHPWHFYLYVPLQNLQKAIFKTSLVNPKSKMVGIFSNILFFFRSFLILLGIFATAVFVKRKNRMILSIGVYFLVLYFLLCFGTGVDFRNIEMRYFLSADVLLLLPVAGLFGLLIEKRKDKLLRKKIT